MDNQALEYELLFIYDVIMLLLKALHIIGGVSWFAGLIYLGRIFIYDANLDRKKESYQDIHDQFLIMSNRVWLFICQPAMVFTLIFGISTAIYFKSYYQPWFHIKIGFIVALLIYQFQSYRLLKQIRNQQLQPSQNRYLRIFNEVLTLILVGLVTIAVCRQFVSIIWAYLILCGIVFLIAILRLIYKKIKLKKVDLS